MSLPHSSHILDSTVDNNRLRSRPLVYNEVLIASVSHYFRIHRVDMAMSETDTNQASEPMTATIATKSVPAAVGEAIELDKVVNAAHNSGDNSNDVPVSTVVPSDVDKNDRPISQVVKNQDEKQSVSNTGDASSEEESPKLVANLKQPQEVAPIPSQVSNPVSPSSVEDDASKSTIGGLDDSVAVTKKPESAVAGEECGAMPACMLPIDTKTKKGKLSSTPSDSLRRGKWTPEEEAYVTRVITDFNAGVLRAPPGTTLRTYLSEKLNCDPMRITKKFTGELAIGKRVFHALPRTVLNAANIDKAQVSVSTYLMVCSDLTHTHTHTHTYTSITSMKPFFL